MSRLACLRADKNFRAVDSQTYGCLVTICWQITAMTSRKR